MGAALAPQLCRLGLRVALVARDGVALEALAVELRAAGGEAVALPADLSQEDCLPALVERVVAALGPPVVLINNAGVDDFQHFEDASVTGMVRSVAVNLTAPLVLTRLVLPHMMAAGEGQVVSLASVAGLVGTPYGAVYAATKSALIAATHSLRMEFADQPFGFTALCPGFVHGAGMHELHKQEVGRAPGVLGSTTVEAVLAAILSALRNDVGEVIVNSTPLRPMMGLGRALPSLSDWLILRMSGGYMRRLADTRRRAAAEGGS